MKMKEKLSNKVEIPGCLAAEWHYTRAAYTPDFLSKDLYSIASTIPDWNLWSVMADENYHIPKYSCGAFPNLETWISLFKAV